MPSQSKNSHYMCVGARMCQAIFGIVRAPCRDSKLLLIECFQNQTLSTIQGGKSKTCASNKRLISNRLRKKRSENYFYIGCHAAVAFIKDAVKSIAMNHRWLSPLNLLQNLFSVHRAHSAACYNEDARNRLYKHSHFAA